MSEPIPTEGAMPRPCTDDAGVERRPAPPPLAVCSDLPAAMAALDSLLGRCRRQARTAAVLWVDLLVSDPDTGRSLLQAMGQRLSHRVRATDSVLQLGSEGFVVLLIDAGAPAAAGVRERLLDVLQGPYRVGRAYLAPLLLRLGCAVSGLDGQEAETLLRTAASMAGRTL